jgi:hypothetical protein
VDYAISYARTVAGVHFPGDNIAGLTLGQELLAAYLPDFLHQTYGSDTAAVEAKIETLRFDWNEFLYTECGKNLLFDPEFPTTPEPTTLAPEPTSPPAPACEDDPTQLSIPITCAEACGNFAYSILVDACPKTCGYCPDDVFCPVPSSCTEHCTNQGYFHGEWDNAATTCLCQSTQSPGTTCLANSVSEFTATIPETIQLPFGTQITENVQYLICEYDICSPDRRRVEMPTSSDLVTELVPPASQLKGI